MPREIDPASGYRYYSPEQAADFRLIQTYKEAGFALDEIRVLLHGDPSHHNALMDMKRTEIHNNVQVLQNKLSLLDSLSRRPEQKTAPTPKKEGDHYEN